MWSEMRWISAALTCDDVVSPGLADRVAGRGGKEGLERHDVCEGRVSERFGITKGRGAAAPGSLFFQQSFSP